MEHNKSTKSTEIKTCKQKTKKPKRRDKTDLGADFVAPDGGWGWVVCLAAGFSSFCVFTPVQQYGIIYRQRMYDLGINAKQVTTIINSELATAALTGVINGALFRRFTYRQAALAGGVLVFIGILLTAYCRTFWQYFICFSCLYGIGLGTNLSATALAVNTYFKIHRRRAMGFSTTVTGLGPIILPPICTFLLQVYGTKGTILLVAAFSLNTLVCGLTLQPVKWHAKCKKKKIYEAYAEKFELVTLKCQHCNKPKSMDSEKTPATFSNPKNDSKKPEMSSASPGNNSDKKQYNIEGLQSAEYELKTSSGSEEKPTTCTCAEQVDAAVGQSHIEESKKTLTFKEKCIKFFDLDLLKDLTFVNLIQGMTIMMFCELNFSFLTPFILASYGYHNDQISIVMSLLGIVDIIVRFTAPFALDRVKISNNILFAIGIVILLVGRIFVTFVDSIYSMVAVFLIMGFGKGFRSIFAPLLIPSYVPLQRLAAASGLQLFSNALFTMALGPVLGFVADISSYSFTIHLMNLMTIGSLMLWVIEWLAKSMKPNLSQR